MALYAIGDLHLHFETSLKPHMRMRDSTWRGHEEVFKKDCAERIFPDDTLVLVGDNSFGRKLEECTLDMEYMAALPGVKILIRGNHDYYWDVKKTASMNKSFGGRLNFLQNNFFSYEDYAIVGTKGHCFEGPFYLDRKGKILGWDEKKEKESDKLVKREVERLVLSFEAARVSGYRKYLMFLHYPPTNILEDESPFTRIAEEYGAEQVVYAHSHGESRFHDSIQGEYHGIHYSLVSGDYLKWRPKRLL